MMRSPKLRKSADGAPCCMRGPTCNGGQGDVAWRHSNHARHGKGMGQKAHDLFGFYGCQPCEDWYAGADLPKAEKLAAFLEAWERSMIYACETGAI